MRVTERERYEAMKAANVVCIPRIVDKWCPLLESRFLVTSMFSANSVRKDLEKDLMLHKSSSWATAAVAPGNI